MTAKFYKMRYGDIDVWMGSLATVAPEGPDPDTGYEDFTELRAIKDYIAQWSPGMKWDPQPLHISAESDGVLLNKTDRIYCSTIGPVISERAIERLGELLEQGGRVLPLHVVNRNDEFYLWWVPVIANSVNFVASEKFPNGKSIKTFVFDDAVVGNLLAFRPHWQGAYKPNAQGTVFVSETFRLAWEEAQLTGIDFRLV